ncbi:MAG: TOBE domain-containing protein, partial [Aggregatilineales bacterium]
TDVGEFQFDAANHDTAPTGDTMLTIRPEQIRLNEQHTHNVVQGRVRERIYVGTYTRYKIQLGNHEIEAIRSADLPGSINVDDTVDVHFPSDRIWVVPEHR